MKKTKVTKKNKGFTLVELLIVISVIGVLSGIIYNTINVSGLRSKTRDSQRKADAKKIQTALELYYTDNRKYPLSPSFTVVSNLGLSPTYINVVPTDPKSGSSGTSCAIGGSYGYYYRSDSSAQRYVVAIILENSTTESLLSSLYNCSSGSINCGVTSSNRCYGVENPF